MDNRIDRRYLIIGAELLLLGGISLTGMYNFLLFHTLVELFSIVVAYSIFMVGWHSFHRDDYFLLLGIAYGAVATLDLLHTMSYKGIGIFPGGADRPTQLWIAARYLESVSLLVAPLLYGRRLRSDLVGAGYAAITVLLIGSIFWWDIFPACYIEGVGLTPFKTVSEYLISLILLAAMAAMIQKRALFAPPTLRLLLLSIAATIGAELAFTFYVSVYGLSNQIGHLLKLVSFYLIYKAIVETGLKRPHTLLFRQLSEYKQALRQSQALLLEAEKMARLGSWEWDLATGIITCSEGWQRIHGVEGERFPIEELFPIAHPDDRERVQVALQDALSGRRPYDIEHRIIRQDTGEERTVQAYGRVVWDEAGQPIKMYGTAQDITERKQMETALRQSEEKYRVLFNSFPLGITVSDAAGNIVEANRFSEKLLGISQAEQEQRAINGTQWRIIRPDGASMPPDEYASVRALQENRLVEQVEMGIVKPKEEITWISVTAAPLPLTEYGVVIVYEDITKRKQAEQALKESEANIRYILKYNPNAIAVYDNNLNYIHVSDRYLEDYNVQYKDN